MLLQFIGKRLKTTNRMWKQSPAQNSRTASLKTSPLSARCDSLTDLASWQLACHSIVNLRYRNRVLRAYGYGFLLTRWHCQSNWPSASRVVAGVLHRPTEV